MYELISIHEHTRWQKAVELFEVSDIYYTDQYFLSALKLDPGEALMFHYIDEQNEGEIIYPFIKRTIEHNGSVYFDITTPFGYGGPLAKDDAVTEELINNFLASFSDFCSKESIIAEYLRFHPLQQNAMLFKDTLELVPLYETFTMQLGESLLKEKESDAQEEKQDDEVIVKKLGTVRYLFEFLILYYSTVRRREESDSYYFFTNDYFEMLISSLGPDLHLFGAFHKNKLVSASFVLAKGDAVYHHIHGNSNEYEAPDAMRKLLLAIAEWGMDNHYPIFHLGADFEGDELPLKHLKQEMSNMDSSVFYIARKIHDPAIYHRISQAEETDFIKRYRNV